VAGSGGGIIGAPVHAVLRHPFTDFDFGEWGTGLWRRSRPDFGALWQRYWGAYAAPRYPLALRAGPARWSSLMPLPSIPGDITPRLRFS
jgi:hypothetical protein